MGADKHDVTYYLKCMFGGVLACGFTHTGIVPLDVVKCRKQVFPDEYKSISQGFQKIKAGEGYRALTLVSFFCLKLEKKMDLIIKECFFILFNMNLKWGKKKFFLIISFNISQPNIIFNLFLSSPSSKFFTKVLIYYME